MRRAVPDHFSNLIAESSQASTIATTAVYQKGRKIVHFHPAEGLTAAMCTCYNAARSVETTGRRDGAFCRHPPSRGSMFTPHYPAEDPAIRKAVIPARARYAPSAADKRFSQGAIADWSEAGAGAHRCGTAGRGYHGSAFHCFRPETSDPRLFWRNIYRRRRGPRGRVRPSSAPMLVCLQESQRGLGDALLYAEEWTSGSPFVVSFGDCIIDAPDPSAPLRRLLAAARRAWRWSDCTGGDRL